MKYLYSLPVPERSQPTERNSLGKQLAKQGLTGESGESVVTPIASDAADLMIEGQYRWGERISTMLATELDELADSGLSELPLYRRDGDGDGDFENRGFYALESVDVEPLHPNDRAAWAFDASLAFEGSLSGHRRSVATDVGQVQHAFGNDTRALVGVPAAADHVQWFDGPTGQTESPSVVATRTAEFGDVDVVDARSAAFQSPTLIYRLDYADQGKTDVSVWDRRGNAERTDADGVRQWQKVFATGHDFDGAAVLSNGIVRLVIDTTAPSLAAERWDSGTSSWTGQSLGSSDWELTDVDLSGVGLAEVDARLCFDNPTDDSVGPHDLDCHIKRGHVDPLWDDPDGGAPQGLVDLLDPIASEQVYDAGESVGLVARSEVR